MGVLLSQPFICFAPFCSSDPAPSSAVIGSGLAGAECRPFQWDHPVCSEAHVSLGTDFRVDRNAHVSFGAESKVSGRAHVSLGTDFRVDRNAHVSLGTESKASGRAHVRLGMDLRVDPQCSREPRNGV